MMIFWFIVPNETPKYLIVSGRPAQAYDWLTNGSFGNLRISRSDFTQTMQFMALRKSDRGKISDIIGKSRGSKLMPLLFLWFSQAMVYWGAMSVLPLVYEFWRSEIESQKSQVKLEVLVILYVFELVGIIAAGWWSLRDKSCERPLLWFSATGTILIGLSMIVLGITNGGNWWLFFSTCLVFGCLTPIWGILFVISTEYLPTQSKATGLGILMSTRIVQGFLELFIAPSTNQIDVLVFSCVGFVSSLSAVWVSWKYFSAVVSSKASPPPAAAFTRKIVIVDRHNRGV
jgi:hypothetical protein